MAVEEFELGNNDFNMVSTDNPEKIEEENAYIQSKMDDKPFYFDASNSNIANNGLLFDICEGPSCSSKSSPMENNGSTFIDRKLKKQVKRLSRTKLEAMLTRKVMKLMESEDKLKELQQGCLSLQEEVRAWKSRSNSLAKNSKNLAELVRETVIKPQKNRQEEKTMSSVSMQVGTSFLVKDNGVGVFKVPKSMNVHPAPLPNVPNSATQNSSKTFPPKLKLQVSNISQGIQLFWTLEDATKGHSEVQNYEIYAYLETSKPPSIKCWKKVGDVKAIPLPIRCTLSQFKKGSKYHFSVRAKDVNSHCGDYSEIKSVIL